MPELATRTKLDLVIDRAHLDRFVEVLDGRGVQGYTVFESLSGKGTRGAWIPDRLTDASDRVLVLAVTSSETAEEVLEDLAALFETFPGVAFASEVRVLRPDRF